MSDIAYERCPSDDWKAGTAQIGVNPKTGQAIELNINGVSAIVAIQSALLTLSAMMKAGYEEDFLEKITLCLSSKLRDDPHAICPLLTVLSTCMLMLRGETTTTFDDENCITISPLNVLVDRGPVCMYDNDNDDDEERGEECGTDEGPMDGVGPGPTRCNGNTGREGGSPIGNNTSGESFTSA